MRGERCGLADRRAWGGGPQAAHARGKGPTKGWGPDTRGAHPKHMVHGRDLGRVEAQRLIERLRLLLSQ